MTTPDFYKEIKTIKLQDELADFLGAFEDGIIEFSYEEVAKMAGHSCATVASSYLMIAKALQFLHPNEIAKRGNIEVFINGAKDEGVNGVIAKVASLITGACEEDGFGGIAGNFNRKNLLFFEKNLDCDMMLRRKDNQKCAKISLDLSQAGGDPRQNMLLQKIIQGVANQDEKNLFKTIWQTRVRKILVENFDNAELVRVK